MIPSLVEIRLPDWAAALAETAAPMPDVVARMRFVVAASRENVARGAGGPFAAAVFERDTGRLVSLGVNLVERGGLSILHAEIVALALAQKRLGAYDLSAPGLPACELVSSAEPCAMCLGAVPWSGVRRLVAGARGEDVEAVGFDEGAKPADWPASLASRGVELIRDLSRDEAAAVLADYARLGRAIYNPRRQG